MKAIRIEAFRNPAEVAKAVDIPDVGAPAAGEMVIAIEASLSRTHSVEQRTQHELWRYGHDRSKSPPDRPCCPTAR